MGEGIVGGYDGEAGEDYSNVVVETVTNPLFVENFVSVTEECYEKCRGLRDHIGELAINTIKDGESKTGVPKNRAVVCDRFSGFLRTCRATDLFVIGDDNRVLSSDIEFGYPHFDRSRISQYELMQIASEQNGRLSISQSANIARR